MSQPVGVAARSRAWLDQQVGLSLGTLLVGAAALTVSVVGSVILLVARGITPAQSLVETIISPTQGLLLWIGLATGGIAVVGGALFFRYMPTKPAREASVAGAALGVQAILACLLYMWFRTGQPEIFVRNFLSFVRLEGLGPAFIDGARNTVILALLGELLGVVIGLIMAMLILSARAVVRAPARAYINFFRGTPLLWQLSFFSVVIIIGFGLFGRNPFAIAILILGINAGAYTAEIFRAGIQSIERGQMEAARSLGMSYPQSMRHAILPQAIRRVIPPLTNEFVILIKDTSLIVILGLTAAQRELLSVGRDAYSETFNATPFLGSALGYLAVTLPMIRLVTVLEKSQAGGSAMGALVGGFLAQLFAWLIYPWPSPVASAALTVGLAALGGWLGLRVLRRRAILGGGGGARFAWAGMAMAGAAIPVLVIRALGGLW
jgi:polar amino acid transport system permease protein